MTGMIGVISDHAARYTWFNQCLTALLSETSIRTRGIVYLEWRVGANRGVSRDSLARECLDQQCDWLFMIDDDQVCQPETIMNLLAADHPVVSALILQRGTPFLPTAYAAHQDGKFSPLDLRSVQPGLVAVAGVGTGALLVKADVFKQLDDGRPWFLYSEDYGEDLYFSNRCKEAGIQMLVDTNCPVGHLIPAAVLPAWLGNRWGVGIQLADGTSTSMEMKH